MMPKVPFFAVPKFNPPPSFFHFHRFLQIFGSDLAKVPWKSLGKEPVIVLIDRVFVLAYHAPDDRTLKEEDREKLLETKLQQIEEAESATLDARVKSKLGSVCL